MKLFYFNILSIINYRVLHKDIDPQVKSFVVWKTDASEPSGL